MKPILLFTILLSLSMSGLAQLPVKDGIVYYKFQENIESDTCASSYVINASEIMLYDKINGEIFIYNNKKSSEKKKTSNKVGRIGIFIPCVESLTKNCSASARVNNDTKLEISLTSELVPIKFVDVLGDYKKTKFLAGDIITNPILEFDENNNYTLKFKGFIFNFYAWEGGNMIPKKMELGEFYEKYQNNSEKSEVIDEMFQEIDDMINFLNNTLKEQLQKSITIAELD